MKRELTILLLGLAGVLPLARGQTEAGTDLEADEPAAGNVLPVFGSGPYPEAFVVVRDPRYDFVLDGKGAGVLYLKDEKGQVLKPPLRVAGLALNYKRKGAVKLNNRAVESINEKNLKPMSNPAEVRFSGQAEDGVTFKSAYTFSRGTIRADFDSRDPEGISPPTMARTGVASPPIKAPGGPEESEKIFSSWKATFDTASGRLDCNYWQSMKGRNFIRSVTLKGPWGAREVRIDFSEPAALILYSGMPLRSGFGLVSTAVGKKKDDPDKAVGVKVTVK